MNDQEKALIALTLFNAERHGLGIASLAWDYGLEAIAREKAILNERAGRVDHTDLYGRHLKELLEAHDIIIDRTYAEILAGVIHDPREAVRKYLESPEHAAHIRNPLYTRTGIAYHEGYWAALLGE